MREQKNIKEGRIENGTKMMKRGEGGGGGKEGGRRKREREVREQGRMTSIGRNRRAPACSNDQNT